MRSDVGNFGRPASNECPARAARMVYAHLWHTRLSNFYDQQYPKQERERRESCVGQRGAGLWIISAAILAF